MKKLLKSRYTALVAATLGVAAILGGSLGIVAAGTRQPLGAGFNLAGGPLNSDVTPDQYVACLPVGSWNAVYIWDGVNQTWQHYFTTTGANAVPAYVNSSGSGGIVVIPKFSGVVILMQSAVASPRLKDSSSESCTP